MSLDRLAHGRRVGLERQTDAIFHLETRFLSQLLDVSNDLTSCPLASKFLRHPHVQYQLRAIVAEPSPTLWRPNVYENVVFIQHHWPSGAGRLETASSLALPNISHGSQGGQPCLHLL